jgi:bifunctional DNA-binding transcriptional regulator/antitoxin component of YhaV-PrlF toxin-antitoxin module
MTTLTITAKGQVTLKRDLLKHLGVSPGEKIEAERLPDGRIVVRAAAQDGNMADFVGCLSQKQATKLTIDEMNKIAVRGWANSLFQKPIRRATRSPSGAKARSFGDSARPG